MTEQTATRSAAVAGAGGNLGSQLTGHLARMTAFARILVIDPDRYEPKNLAGQDILPRDVGKAKAHVQARKMKAINAALDVLPFRERVEDVPLGLMRSDIVLGGLDSKLARMRANRIAARLGMPFIDAGIRRDGLLGRITVCDTRRGTACAECAWDAVQYENMARRVACLDEEPGVPATDAPSELGGVVASYQAAECRKRIASGDGGMEAAYRILIDLVHHTVRMSVLPRNPDCRCDHRPWVIRPLDVDPAKMTAGELLELGREDHDAAGVWLGMHGKTFVFSLTCPVCGTRRRIARLDHRIPEGRRTCPGCAGRDGSRMIVAGDAAATLGAGTHPKILGRTLAGLGFRPRDVVTLRGPQREIHYEIRPAAAGEGRGDAS